MSPQETDKLSEETASWGDSSCGDSSGKDPPQRRRSCLADNSPKEGPKKTVNFDDVHIREFKVTLGDHPSVTQGPPVTLDWTPVATHVLGVDQFETTEDQKPRERRSSAELKMPPQVRKNLLNGDHTKQEMKQAEAAARRIQSQRNLSMAMVDIEGIEIAWQSSLRKFKRWSKTRNEPLEPAELWLQQYKLQRKHKIERKSCLDRTSSTIISDDDESIRRCHSSPNLRMTAQEATLDRVAARKKISG